MIFKSFFKVQIKCIECLYNIKGTDIPNEIKIFNNVHVF